MKVIIDTDNVQYLMKDSKYFTPQDIELIQHIIGKCIETGSLTAQIERLQKEVSYWKDSSLYYQELAMGFDKLKETISALENMRKEGEYKGIKKGENHE